MDDVAARLRDIVDRGDDCDALDVLPPLVDVVITAQALIKHAKGDTFGRDDLYMGMWEEDLDRALQRLEQWT